MKKGKIGNQLLDSFEFGRVFFREAKKNIFMVGPPPPRAKYPPEFHLVLVLKLQMMTFFFLTRETNKKNLIYFFPLTLYPLPS